MYGIDLEDEGLLTRRSWRWLRTRISGLLDRPPVYVTDGHGRVRSMPSTRLGFALYPPSDREE